MTTEVDAILCRAADLIDERGWWNGVGSIPSGGPGCLMMGIGSAVMDLRISFATAGPLIDMELAKRLLELPWYGSAVEWNDAPGRTQEEVTNLLRGKTLTPVHPC